MENSTDFKRIFGRNSTAMDSENFFSPITSILQNSFNLPQKAKSFTKKSTLTYPKNTSFPLEAEKIPSSRSSCYNEQELMPIFSLLPAKTIFSINIRKKFLGKIASSSAENSQKTSRKLSTREHTTDTFPFPG